MKILPSISIMLLSALTLNAACKENRQQNISNTPTEMTDNQTTAVTAEENEVTVTCIRDNKKERIMPLSLFGNIPQSLIDSLGISNGICKCHTGKDRRQDNSLRHRFWKP